MRPRTDVPGCREVPGRSTAADDFWRWNEHCARVALRASRDQSARTVGVVIPSDDSTGARPLRVLALLDLFCPPGVVVRAVVPTGSAALTASIERWHAGARGGVVSVDVKHDPAPFGFARRINMGASLLLDARADVDAILLANDDTAPTPAACARLATWPTHNALVGAVSNAGGGGLQTVDAPSGVPSAGGLIDCPHRLGGFFLYVTRDVWTTLDGFDEDYAGYGCDDTAFSLDAHALGARILIDPFAFVWHEGSATFGPSAIPDLHPKALAIFHRKHPHIARYTRPLRLPPSLTS